MSRGACAASALLALGLAWLPDWAARFGEFPAHMLAHMILVAVATPLLVLAVPPDARPAPPVLAAVLVEFAVVWGYHLPALHRMADAGPVGLAVEQALFLGAGLTVWASALASASPLAGAAGLLLTSMHMTLLGALLVLAQHDLYARADAGSDLAAQQLGGILMLAIGTPAYLLGGLALTGRALRGAAA